MNTNHYYYPTTIRMRCIRAVCLLFATLWGLSGPAQAADFRMKSVSPDFLWSGSAADAGTFENVNAVSETLYFSAGTPSIMISAHRLSDARTQSFGGSTFPTQPTRFLYSVADAREWVSAGGGINLSSQPIPFSDKTSAAEDVQIVSTFEGRQPRKAVAYSNSHYYTISAESRPIAEASAYPTYRPMLTQVGAQQAAQMAWTSTDESTPDPFRVRARNGLDPGLSSPNQDKESPVGEAWALLAFAALYAGWTFLRKKEAEVYESKQEPANLNNSTF